MKTVKAYTVGLVSFELLDTGEEIVLHVTEPPLSEEASQLYFELREYFSKHFELNVAKEEDRWIAAERLGKARLYEEWKHAIDYYLMRDYSGYGMIDPFIKDPAVEEIGVIGGDYVRVVHRDFAGWIRTNVLMKERDAIILAQRLAVRAGTSISPLFPLREFNLNGNRISVVLGGSGVSDKTSITIRKLSAKWELDSLVNVGMLPRELATLLLRILTARGMILVIGAQGAGKTTLLAALLDKLPEHMRVVTVEEVPEIRLDRGNWVSLKAREAFSLDVASERVRVSFRELLRAALRMRADVLAVAEARGEEVRYIFEAAALGSASAATFHANSIDELERRLRLLGIDDYYLDLVWIVVQVASTRKGRRLIRAWSREDRRWVQVAEWVPERDEWILSNAPRLESRIKEWLRVAGT